MKKFFIFILLIIFGFNNVYANKYDDLYGKIDLFGEVLEKISQSILTKLIKLK